jgi:glycine hydroxymethyltransferase
VTSGIRIGTPAVTTRGMKEKEMETIADFIARALNNVSDDAALRSVGDDVRELCRKFPIYPNRIKRQ